MGYLIAIMLVLGAILFGAGFSKDLVVFWVATIVFGGVPSIALMVGPEDLSYPGPTFLEGLSVVIGCWCCMALVWAGHYAAAGSLPL